MIDISHFIKKKLALIQERNNEYQLTIFIPVACDYYFVFIGEIWAFAYTVFIKWLCLTWKNLKN